MRWSNQPARTPPIAAITSPLFQGSPRPAKASQPEVAQASRSGRVRIVGAIMAKKVSGIANPSDNSFGMVALAKTPTTVEICQKIHNVTPAPSR